MKLGVKAKENHSELVKVFGASSSFDTVARWIRQFSGGRESLEDERSGRPHSSLTRDILAHAEAIVPEDSSITLRSLASKLDISFGGANSLYNVQ